MRRALDETFLLWALLGVALLMQAAIALGIHVPLIERTGAWRFATQPWAAVALAGVSAGIVLALAYGPGPRDRRARVISWISGALAAACFFAFDPATAGALAYVAANLHRSYPKQARQA